MRWVEQGSAVYGLNRTLQALGLSKGTWHYRQNNRRPLTDKYAELRAPLLRIAREHPHYGYRKVTSELRHAYGLTLNAKAVRKLQKTWELPLIRVVHRPKPSAIRRVLIQMGNRINLVAKRAHIAPLQVLYTDFTELPFDRGQQKAQLMPLVDHCSKYLSNCSGQSRFRSIMTVGATWLTHGSANSRMIGLFWGNLCYLSGRTLSSTRCEAM